jgi:GNAT superfamily N-acetyltransferase
MRTERIASPAEFVVSAASLLEDEARHNLMLGVVNTLVRSPEVYPDYRLFLVRNSSRPAAAAVITAPYDVIVADSDSDEAIAELVHAIAAADVAVPGALGNRPTVDRFVAEWCRVTGDTTELRMRQGVFALSVVIPIRQTAGVHRPAVVGDRPIVDRWLREFHAEALPDEPLDEELLDRMVAARLKGEGPNAYWVWLVDGQPVSLSGHGNPTGSGIRIGPVYTPPAERGNGYATALVAAQSQWLLENGYSFCFLYTDLANPTSNAIYERIGYRRVAESAVYGFKPIQDI